MILDRTNTSLLMAKEGRDRAVILHFHLFKTLKRYPELNLIKSVYRVPLLKSIIGLGEYELIIENSFLAFPTNLQGDFSNSFKHYYCRRNQTNRFII